MSAYFADEIATCLSASVNIRTLSFSPASLNFACPCKQFRLKLYPIYLLQVQVVMKQMSHP